MAGPGEEKGTRQLTPVVILPILRLVGEPVRVVVVRREQPRAVLADGSPVALTDPRCAIDRDGTREEATVFREYVALRADTLEPVVLSFSGAREKLARTLNVLLELPKLAHAGRSRKRIIGEFATFAQVFAVSASSVVPDGFCSPELFQMAEATYENLRGRRLVIDGVASL